MSYRVEISSVAEALAGDGRSRFKLSVKAIAIIHNFSPFVPRIVCPSCGEL